MKELYQAVKHNGAKGAVFYLLPFILLIIKIKYYDMHRFDRFMAVTGLRNYSRLSELIAIFLFVMLVFFLAIAYQKLLLTNGSVLESLSYSLRKGLKLMFSTLIYGLLLSFTASAVNFFLVPLMFLSFGSNLNLLVRMAINVVAAFSIIVHVIAKIEDNNRYKNPFTVLFEIKSQTFVALCVMVALHAVASAFVSLIFEYVIPFRYTAYMQNNIAIFTYGLTFLLLIAIQNYSVIYYKMRTQKKELQEEVS